MGLWAVLVYAQPTRAAECPGHVVSTSTGPNPSLGLAVRKPTPEMISGPGSAVTT